MSIRVNCTIAYGEENLSRIKAVIQQIIPKIAPLLAGDLSWYSPHARLVAESFKIDSLKKIAANQFKMIYQFDGHIFSPCLDLNEIFTRQEQVIFQILPDTLEFDVIENRRPSPADEL